MKVGIGGSQTARAWGRGAHMWEQKSKKKEKQNAGWAHVSRMLWKQLCGGSQRMWERGALKVCESRGLSKCVRAGGFQTVKAMGVWRIDTGTWGGTWNAWSLISVLWEVDYSCGVYKGWYLGRMYSDNGSWRDRLVLGCTLDRRACVTSEGKRIHADIGKVTSPSSGTGTSMDINFRFHLWY